MNTLTIKKTKNVCIYLYISPSLSAGNIIELRLPGTEGFLTCKIKKRGDKLW